MNSSGVSDENVRIFTRWMQYNFGMNLLRYQNSSAEFPEQIISTYASSVVSGMSITVAAPASLSTVKKLGSVGDKLDRGIMRSGVSGVGKAFVGA